MDEFWTIPTANMMYTISQNYTNMMVMEYKTVKIVVVVLLLL